MEPCALVSGRLDFGHKTGQNPADDLAKWGSPLIPDVRRTMAWAVWG